MSDHQARRMTAYCQTITFAVALSYIVLAIVDSSRAEEWWWPYALLMAVLTGVTLACYKLCGKIGRKNGS